jgi:hypothetical protein
MFVRFRATTCRLQVSLVETRRANGRVRHEHIASFGAVEVPLTIRGRAAFWQRLHERLAKLSNRIDATAQAKLLGEVHARIPMVTIDELVEVKVENAEADERLWSSLREMHEEQTKSLKQLAAGAESGIAENQSAADDAAAKAAEAKERVERLKRGEDVPGGLGKPVDVEQLPRRRFARRARAGRGKLQVRPCPQCPVSDVGRKKASVVKGP